MNSNSYTHNCRTLTNVKPHYPLGWVNFARGKKYHDCEINIFTAANIYQWRLSSIFSSNLPLLKMQFLYV